MMINPLDKSGFTFAMSAFWGKVLDKFSSLAKVALSGKYIDLTGRPTKLSEFENDAGFKTTDTTYGVVSRTANGLAPKLPNETATTKYLRQDGTWAVPPDTNTTYGAATQSAAGLMSAADKKKLDGFKGIANNDTTTEAGFAWDARRGKVLRDDVDALNSALGKMYNINKVYSDNRFTNIKNFFVEFTAEYWDDICANGGATLALESIGQTSYIGIAIPQTGSISQSIRYILVNLGGGLYCISINKSGNLDYSYYTSLSTF